MPAAVPLVAQNVLDYLGQVGPPRRSGYANALDAWEDSGTILNLARAAADTVDNEGVRILLKSSKIREGIGVQLAVEEGFSKSLIICFMTRCQVKDHRFRIVLMFMSRDPNDDFQISLYRQISYALISSTIKTKLLRMNAFGLVSLLLFTTNLWGEVKPVKKITKELPPLTCKDNIRFAASWRAGTDIASQYRAYHFKVWTSGLFEVFESSGMKEVEVTVKGRLEEAQMALLFSKLEAAQFFSFPTEKPAPEGFLPISVNWSMSYCKDGKTKTIQNLQSAKSKSLLEEAKKFFQKQLEARKIKIDIE